MISQDVSRLRLRILPGSDTCGPALKPELKGGGGRRSGCPPRHVRRLLILVGGDAGNSTRASHEEGSGSDGERGRSAHRADACAASAHGSVVVPVFNKASPKGVMWCSTDPPRRLVVMRSVFRSTAAC